MIFYSTIRIYIYIHFMRLMLTETYKKNTSDNQIFCYHESIFQYFKIQHTKTNMENTLEL